MKELDTTAGMFTQIFNDLMSTAPKPNCRQAPQGSDLSLYASPLLSSYSMWTHKVAPQTVRDPFTIIYLLHT